MIILYNPRATRPKNRRLPLSVLAIGAVLEGREEFWIVDGNLDPDPAKTIATLIRENNAEMLAMTVMPGPQTAASVATIPQIRAQFPHVPIVWGGYFATNYSHAALNAPYVDYLVRGQGEGTFLELLDAVRGRRDIATIAGVSYKHPDGTQQHNCPREMKPLDTWPWYPYHRLPVEQYLLPTFLGRRTAVHQASIGCPYRCSFCGVVTFSGSRQKIESPRRTAEILTHLARTYGADAVQFYDNNFFLREDNARELADRIAPLGMRWWCEARIDIMSRYSDATWEAIRRAGCAMIFFGAESGNDAVLKDMQKDLTAEQTLEVAARIRQFDIIPEFSFIFGNPKDPENDRRECFRFIRKIKRLNPSSEIIVQHYTPVPQRERMYGDVEMEFPTSPDEWAIERWQKYATQKDVESAWVPVRTKRLIDNFDLVVSSRWPSAQDIRLSRWGRWLLQALSSWRYRLKVYSYPFELRWAQRWLQLRKPKVESL
jgi:radical SAM superfamily enzyme YgiQ (UPF0313 family)